MAKFQRCDCGRVTQDSRGICVICGNQGGEPGRTGRVNVKPRGSVVTSYAKQKNAGERMSGMGGRNWSVPATYS